jgi:hypothetical protein
MDETLIWCALIGAVAYVTRGAFPSYYELTKAKHGRIDAINDQVDDNEQTMLAMGKKIEDMQSDIAGHLTRIDDLEENVRGYRVMIEVLQREASKAGWEP